MAPNAPAVLAALPLAAAAQQRRRTAAPRHPLAAYRSDPVAFVRDCLVWRDGEAPAPYQEEILAELPARRRVAVRGPHGLGKTALEAWACLWFALTRDAEAADWKAPTTASAWRQLTKFLWPELRKWARRLRWERIGRPPFDPRHELLGLSLKLDRGEAFAVASDTPETLEGAHAEALLYLFDEAKIIPPDTFDAVEGAFSGAGPDTAAEAYALAVSTPGEPAGRFYEIHRRAPGFEDWWTRHVTLDEAIGAGRISRAWAEQRARQWGEKSAVYQNRVLGEFASGDEAGVIPLGWVEAANERWREHDERRRPAEPLTAVGVDVARFGEDRTVLALRVGDVVTELRRSAKEDTMATAGRVRGLLGARGGRAIVDVIGVGAGVVDRLREQGLDVTPFNAAEGTDAKDTSGELGFANRRSAAWWRLRELLDPSGDHALALPPDDTLTGDLTAPTWKPTSGGKVQVEGKDEIRARLGRSTDDGDAVVMAFEPEGAPRGVFLTEPWKLTVRAMGRDGGAEHDPAAGLSGQRWRPKVVRRDWAAGEDVDDD